MASDDGLPTAAAPKTEMLVFVVLALESVEESEIRGNRRQTSSPSLSASSLEGDSAIGASSASSPSPSSNNPSSSSGAGSEFHSSFRMGHCIYNSQENSESKICIQFVEIENILGQLQKVSSHFLYIDLTRGHKELFASDPKRGKRIQCSSSNSRGFQHRYATALVSACCLTAGLPFQRRFLTIFPV